MGGEEGVCWFPLTMDTSANGAARREVSCQWKINRLHVTCQWQSVLLPIFRFFLSIFLSFYLSIFLSFCLSVFLSSSIHWARTQVCYLCKWTLFPVCKGHLALTHHFGYWSFVSFHSSVADESFSNDGINSLQVECTWCWVHVTAFVSG